MIVVIGAGIVGCAAAYELARKGHEVTLLDAEAGPGQGCSLANGGQLSYSYVEPLASPATLRALPKLLFQRDSAVKFRPTRDWRQYGWGLQFLAACRRTPLERATRELLELSFLSRETLDAWMSEGAWEVSFRRNGKLVLCRDETTLARQQRQMRFQATLGCEQQALNPAQCVEREPALEDALRRSPHAFVGGIWTPGECVADTHALCGALVERLRGLGGTLRFGTRVLRFATQGGRVERLITAQGDIACDAVVMAAGSSAARLSAMLGEYLPVYPIKGYSLTLPFAGAGAAPRVNITDLGAKTVFAPLGGELRVAAAAEIAGYDLNLTPERFRQMRQAAERLFPGQVDVEADGRPWAGLRPATPGSLPIVRRARHWANAYWNVGHGALGLTLAAGSAVRLERCLRGD